MLIQYLGMALQAIGDHISLCLLSLLGKIFRVRLVAPNGLSNMELISFSIELGQCYLPSPKTSYQESKKKGKPKMLANQRMSICTLYFKRPHPGVGVLLRVEEVRLG